MADYPTPDIDPQETQEWLAALASVLDTEGPERAHFLLQQMVERARRRGAYLPFDATTAYQNTIPVAKEAHSPGDHELEHRIRAAGAKRAVIRSPAFTVVSTTEAAQPGTVNLVYGGLEDD